MHYPSVTNKLLIFVLTLLACSFDIINVTAVILSTDAIAQKFQVDTFLASWMLSAYAVTFSGFIAFLGRVGDIMGHTRFFAASCLAFAVFSLICAAINSIYGLIVFRALQGVAAAGVVPSGYSIISHTFHGESQNRALASLASVFSVSFGVGFLIGGAFEELSLGYKGTFYVSFGIVLPISVLALGFEKIQPNGQTFKSLDFSGCLLFVSGAILIVVGLTQGGDNWSSASAIAPFITGVVLLGVFLVWNGYLAELPRTQEKLPFLKLVSLLIPREIWETRNSVLLLVALLINYIACFGILLVVIQYCELVEGDRPLISALKTLPSVITMFLCTVLFATRNDILSTLQAFSVGFICMVAGMGILIALPKVDHPFWKIILVAEILTNGGTAFYFTYCITYLIGKAPLSVKGIMSGVSQTFAQFGSALAFSAITSILGDTKNVSQEELKRRFQNTTYFLFGSVVFGAFLVAVVIFRDSMGVQDKEVDQEEFSADAKLDQNSTS